MKHIYSGDSPEPEDIIKNRLMDACIACLQIIGLKKVAITDITAQAGVVRQTFYKHFTNKNDILAQVFERECLSFTLEMRSVVEQAENEEEAFISGFIYIVENLTKNPVLTHAIAPGNIFIDEVNFSHVDFSYYGNIVLAPLFTKNPKLKIQAAEITELWVRNALSFIMLPSSKSTHTNEMRGFVKRRLIPGLNL